MMKRTKLRIVAVALVAMAMAASRWTWATDDGARDKRFLMMPVRADLDRSAPGRYGVKSVRYHMREIHSELEHTVIFEEPLFQEIYGPARASEQMKNFVARLEALGRGPLVSMYVAVIEDPDSPAHNHRWRAVKLPYWAENPPHP